MSSLLRLDSRLGSGQIRENYNGTKICWYNWNRFHPPHLSHYPSLGPPVPVTLNSHMSVFPGFTRPQKTVLYVSTRHESPSCSRVPPPCLSVRVSPQGLKLTRITDSTSSSSGPDSLDPKLEVESSLRVSETPEPVSRVEETSDQRSG